MSELKLFISHSERDKPLVLPLERWLREGLQLSAAESRCTVVTDAGMPIGAVPVEELRKDIAEARVVVVLLTSTSLRSHWVQLETGAAWVGLKLHAIRGPGINFDNLPSPLHDFTSVGYCEKDKMQQLLAQLADRLQTKVSPDAGALLDEVERAGRDRLLGDRAMWFALPPLLSAYRINANRFTGALAELCDKLGLRLEQVDGCANSDGRVNWPPQEVLPVWANDVWDLSSHVVSLMLKSDKTVPAEFVTRVSPVLSPALLEQMQRALTARKARSNQIRDWFSNAQSWIASNMPTHQSSHGS